MRTVGQAAWCSIKHLGQVRIHLEETLEKLYRENPTSNSIPVIEQNLFALKSFRKNLISEYGNKTEQEMGLKEGCVRCKEDLNLVNSFVNKLKQKTLNIKETKGYNSEINMVDKAILETIGGIGLGKAVQIGAEYVDGYFGATAKPLYAKPSTWINIATGILGVIAPAYGYKLKIPSKYNNVLLAMGASILVDKGLDYGMSALTPAAPTAPATPAAAGLGLQMMNGITPPQPLFTTVKRLGGVPIQPEGELIRVW